LQSNVPVQCILNYTFSHILKERINFSDKMFYEPHENAIGRNSSKLRYLYQLE